MKLEFILKKIKLEQRKIYELPDRVKSLALRKTYENRARKNIVELEQSIKEITQLKLF